MIREPAQITEILTLLIDQGVEPSARDYTKEQLRPLHHAVMAKNVSVTRFLLEKDPDMINLVDGEGKTALYHACTTPDQNPALIKELVTKKADFGCQARPPPMRDHGGQEIARYLDKENLT